MSDSVRPHRWKPTRLPVPWESPGKNTGVDCHFLLQFMKGKSESQVAQSCPTLGDPMDCSPSGSSVHGIFPGKRTGVGCPCLLQMVSIDTVKVFDSMQHAFMIRTLSNQGREGSFFNLVKSILKNLQLGFPPDSAIKNPSANARDMGSIPDPGRSHILQRN